MPPVRFGPGFRLSERRDHPLVDLLRRCRAQEESAWTEFRGWFHGLAARVLARFANLTPLEREEAEDMARVSIALEVGDGRVKAEGDGAVVGYARIVLANAARDVWRRRRPQEPLPPDLGDRSPTPAERAAVRAELARLERRIGAWSAEDRFIFVMKLDGASTATIQADLARLFGRHVSPEAIDVRVHRLRGALRRGEEGAPDA